METLFLQVFNMSLTGSYVILAIVLARWLLKKAPKKYAYGLWAAAAFRLVCPVSFSAAFSLLAPLQAPVEQHAVTYVPQNVGLAARPAVLLGGMMLPLPAATPQTSSNPMQTWIICGSVLWCLGMAAMLIYAVVSVLHLRYRLRTAVRLEENVYQSETVCSPFLLGLVRPRIYIPYGLDQQTLDYVLAHERYHLWRKDHWVKAAAYLILMVHWFNPLVWLAFFLMGKDMEMRCDEWVLSGTGHSAKAYSMTLLSFAANRRFPSPSPLAFGEGSVKARIKNALRWKKPRSWVQLLAVVFCLTVVAACAANPAGEGKITLPEPAQTILEPEPVDSPEIPPDFTEISPETPDNLDELIHQEILRQNASGQTDPDVYAFESHVELAHLVACGAATTDDPEAMVGRDTIYMMVLYLELKLEGGQLVEVAGSHMPVAMTVETLQNQSMQVTEYWTPRDGDRWLPDIQRKFPSHVLEQVDTQLWIEQQRQEIYQQAEQMGLQ